MKALGIVKYTLIYSILSVAFFTQTIEAQALEIGFYNTNAVPFKWKEKDEFVGPILDIMREVGQRTGIKIELIELPAKRLLFYLEKGQIAGAIGLYKKPEREKYALYIDVPIGWTGANIFVLKGNEFPLSNLTDIYGKKVGAVRGINLGSPFHNAVENGNILQATVGTYESLVKMLLFKRHKMVAAQALPFQSTAAKLGYSHKITMLPYPLMPLTSLHILISKAASISKKSEFIEKMNKVLRHMKKEKEFERIYKKYGYIFDPR